MWRCPVCEKDHTHGFVCNNCGFDSSCDYERNRTLCSVLPKRIEPVSVRAAKRRQRQKQRTAVPLGNHLVCPKCGGKQFFFLIDELQLMCTDCETKVPITAQKDGPVSENVIASGEAGPSLTWTLNDTGVLTISGSGEMYEYMPCSTPWDDHREKITSVVVKPGVTQIGNSAFGWCTSLTSITLPKSVTKIGSNAFWGCSSLTSITLPEGVTQIGWRAFNGCTSLTDVYYSGAEGQWRNIQIRFYNDDLLNAAIHFSTAGQEATPESENVIASGEAGPSLTWTLSDTGVLTISGSGEMYDYDPYIKDLPWKDHREKITSVLVKPGVTTIGNYAFEDCASLASVILPESVTQIGNWAFCGCYSLTSVTLPEGVTQIGWSVFFWCTSLTSITLPEGVTEIGDCAFEGCTSLTDIYYGGTGQQWRNIEIGDDNDNLLNAKIHFR